MSEAIPHREHELSGEARARLEAAHRELTTAVTAYSGLVNGPLEPDQPAPVADADEIGRVQEAVEAAEDHLWKLREELLGWGRPAWVPSASLTSDWFSEEDAVYDDLPETTVS